MGDLGAVKYRRLIDKYFNAANSIIKDPGVESAMLKTDRAHYCPSESPYMDRPYPLGFGATISAPHMHAYALEVLKDKLQEGAKVLDVGSGSGYLTVCFAHMVGPTGTVYGVEHIGELLKKSEENIRRGNRDLLDSGRIKLFRKCYCRCRLLDEQ